jgi:SNF2 family DNA or RNA helicase
MITHQTPELKYKLKPYAHQETALKLSLNMANYGLLMDMGTGKTKVFIDTAVNLYLQGKIDAVLLLAPKGVYMNWVDIELPKHLPDDVPCRVSYWKSAARPELQKDWKDLAKFKGLRWVCANVESLAYASGVKFCEDFAKAHKDRLLVGVDESTMIKNMGANRTKNAIKIGKYASHRRIMTGDAVPKAPTDLYAQCMFLGPQMLGLSSFYAFRNRYCIMKEMKLQNGRSFMNIVGYQRLDELQNRLKGFSYRVTKDECLDLPPKVYQSYDVELTPEQIKIYKQMKEQCVSFLSSTEVITAELALEQLLRLHQIVCGHVKTDDGDIIRIPNNRLTALMEALESITGKVIIWATYVPNIEEIVLKLKEEYGTTSVVHFYGGTSDEARRVAVDRFQNDPTCRFFVGNPSTGRYGLTLTASPYVIYYSNNHNLEHRTQSEDRAHRIGQVSKVTYIDLIARKTIDEKIIKALLQKKHISALVMGDEWREWIK